MALGERLAALDAERFTGRRTLLARVDAVLAAADGTPAVWFVHGPGGIGKSALLREVGRRAAAAGRPVTAVDARALEPVPGALEAALVPAVDADRPVVLLDTFERIPALADELRGRLLPAMPDAVVVVVAGRQPPDPGWFRNGWEHVVVDAPLGPLADDEARRLLGVLGVDDGDEVERVATWAKGSPLALTLAASAARGPTSTPVADVDLRNLIVARLAGDELDRVDGDVVEVAAVARAVDARLLADVLPGRPTREAHRALRSLSVAEPVGNRTTLHDLVRSALRDDLRESAPHRYGELRRRIADHLHARAAAGEADLLLDLAELVDDPGFRQGFAVDGSVDLRVDVWRPGAMDELVAGYTRDLGDPGWWEGLAPLLDAAPELALVARDAGGTAVGFVVATTPGTAPPAAEADPAIGPLLADARAAGVTEAIVWRESHGLLGTPEPGPFALLHTAAVLRSGLANVARSYIIDNGLDPWTADFYAAVGATRRPDLDAPVGPFGPVPCWVIDHGPDGMLGDLRDTVYRETGVAPPTADRSAEWRRAGRAALEHLDRPDLLAASPLAEGDDVAARAASVRARVEAAVDAAFGDAPGDRLLREVVVLADLRPEVSHTAAIAQLSISRSTYFRRLREARARVADAIGAMAPPP